MAAGTGSSRATVRCPAWYDPLHGDSREGGAWSSSVGSLWGNQRPAPPRGLWWWSTGARALASAPWPWRPEAEEQAFLTRLLHVCPEVALTQALTPEVQTFIREWAVPGLDGRPQGVHLSGFPGFVSMARGRGWDR